ncbi:hypothetical protein P4V47_26420, partial [Brevibacillus laterosporus]|nr:hypothetical protein [Brevibacillus laterosporus]
KPNTKKLKPVCSGGIPKHTGCLGFFNTVYLTGVRPYFDKGEIFYLKHRITKILTYSFIKVRWMMRKVLITI